MWSHIAEQYGSPRAARPRCPASAAAEMIGARCTPKNTRGMTTSGLQFLPPGQSGGFSYLRRKTCGNRRFGERQAEPEHRPAASLILCPNPAAMSLDDCSCNRQPHPHAVLLGRKEGLEQMWN